MLNVVAMGMLLWTLGAAMVMSPEPILLKKEHPADHHPVEAVKRATHESLDYAMDAARATGEGIRGTVESALHFPGQAAETIERKAGEAVKAVKSGSQAGLEKIGLAAPAEEEPRSYFERWEDGLQAAKERAMESKLGVQEPPHRSHSEILKEKLANAYGTTKDAAGEAVSTAKEKAANAAGAAKDGVISTEEWVQEKAGAVKDGIVDTGEWVRGKAGAVKDGIVDTGEVIQDRAHTANRSAEEAASAAKENMANTASSGYKSAEEAASAAKDTVTNTVSSGYQSAEDAASAAKEKANWVGLEKEKAFDRAESLEDLRERILRSIQDSVTAAGGKASEATGSAYEYAAGGVKDAAANAKHFVGVEPETPEASPSYLERIQHVTEQAGEILRNRGKEAASHMPNVGQGLSSYAASADTQENSVRDYGTKFAESMGFKDAPDNKKLFHVEEMRVPSDRKKNSEKTLPGQSEYDFMVGVTKDLNDERYSLSVEPTKKNEIHENSRFGKHDTKSWGHKLLDELKISEEKDLLDNDIVIGHFTGLYSGGVYYRTDRDTAPTSTRDKASDAVERAKEATINGAKRVAGNIFGTSNHAEKQENGEDRDIARPLSGGYAEQAGHKISDPDWKMESTVYQSDSTQNAADGAENMKRRDFLLWTRLSAIAVAGLLSSLRVVHLFSFSAVYGSSLWVTFVSGFLLARSVPRHLFGLVQSRIFPNFLRLLAVGQAISLISYIILHPWLDADISEKVQFLVLWISLLTTLANIFFLEPRSTKAMFEKLKMEKEEGRGHDSIGNAEATTAMDDATKARVEEVNKRFLWLHGTSSFVNLLDLISMTLHLWHLSQEMNI